MLVLVKRFNDIGGPNGVQMVCNVSSSILVKRRCIRWVSDSGRTRVRQVINTFFLHFRFRLDIYKSIIFFISDLERLNKGAGVWYKSIIFFVSDLDWIRQMPVIRALFSLFPNYRFDKAYYKIIIFTIKIGWEYCLL
jgi:hypothetical protein